MANYVGILTSGTAIHIHFQTTFLITFLTVSAQHSYTQETGFDWIQKSPAHNGISITVS